MANCISRGESVRGHVSLAMSCCKTAMRLAEESTSADAISLIFLLGDCIENLGECEEFYCENLSTEH